MVDLLIIKTLTKVGDGWDGFVVFKYNLREIINEKQRHQIKMLFSIHRLMKCCRVTTFTDSPSAVNKA